MSNTADIPLFGFCSYEWYWLLTKICKSHGRDSAINATMSPAFSFRKLTITWHSLMAFSSIPFSIMGKPIGRMAVTPMNPSVKTLETTLLSCHRPPSCFFTSSTTTQLPWIMKNTVTSVCVSISRTVGRLDWTTFPTLALLWNVLTIPISALFSASLIYMCTCMYSRHIPYVHNASTFEDFKRHDERLHTYAWCPAKWFSEV